MWGAYGLVLIKFLNVGGGLLFPGLFHKNKPAANTFTTSFVAAFDHEHCQVHTMQFLTSFEKKKNHVATFTAPNTENMSLIPDLKHAMLYFAKPYQHRCVAPGHTVS